MMATARKPWWLQLLVGERGGRNCLSKHLRYEPIPPFHQSTWIRSARGRGTRNGRSPRSGFKSFRLGSPFPRIFSVTGPMAAGIIRQMGTTPTFPWMAPTTSRVSIKTPAATTGTGGASALIRRRSRTPVSPRRGRLRIRGVELVALDVTGYDLVAPPNPVIVNLVFSATNLVVSGSNGLATGIYHLLSTTNLALPLNHWGTVGTNGLTNNGAFTFTATNAVMVS